jgi:Saxitoxin biosynthesis operon protein SxtJ
MMGSNTRFGLVIAAACALVYGWSLWSAWAMVGWLVAAVILLSITLTVPRVLEPLKKLWLRLGWLLHMVASPVLLGLFFFTVVTPIGVGLRFFGKDPLRLKRGASTYWIERQPPGPAPSTMTQLY